MEAICNKVIIKADPVETTTESGIILGGANYERDEKSVCTTGVIVDYGPAAWLDPIMGGKSPVEVGDRVVYAKYSGKFITNPDDNEEYVIINDDAIQVKL